MHKTSFIFITYVMVMKVSCQSYDTPLHVKCYPMVFISNTI